jgi:hypothetical protein
VAAVVIAVGEILLNQDKARKIVGNADAYFKSQGLSEEEIGHIRDYFAEIAAEIAPSPMWLW